MIEIIRNHGVLALAAMLSVLAVPAAQALAKQQEVCAGIAGFACSGGKFCHFEKGECRIPDMQGVCKVRPQGCTKEYMPVCGCDGRTYGNKCMAAAAGTSVLHDGSCPGAGEPDRPKVCGGIAGIGCGGGEFCQFEAGACEIADVQGVCKRRPEMCTEEYLPVCGCDGKTYSNACHAAMAGANVLRRGECGSDRPE